jgi:AmiR/NasT family two-component response regulator
MLVHRREAAPRRGVEDPAMRVHVRLEAVDEPEPGVDRVPPNSNPPNIAREAQSQQPPSVQGSRSHERLRIRIAADHAVHHDDVGRVDLVLEFDEVAVASSHAALQAILREQRGRLPVVLLGELDHRRVACPGLQELDLDRADTAADLEHVCIRHPTLGQAVHDQTRGLVEPLAPVAARITPRQALAEDLPVAGSTTGAHGREVYDQPVRILIAEDETIIRLDLKDLLERSGFEVCAEAKDGLEAVELALSEQPDLAVLDVKMPRLDGIEAARRILDERPIPIVMLTAYGQDELVSRAIEAGVFGYLVKPFREQDLLPAIRTARARHEELAALREQADSLAEALAARKVIERAKGLLMERESLTEEEAFARLRKASQVSGRPMKVVAEAVVATFESDA